MLRRGIVVGQAQRARHAIHLFPGGEGQHPVGILQQFRQRAVGPDGSNLVGQMEIKTVVIEKRNDGGLLGYGTPDLHQLPTAFGRDHPGQFLRIALAQHCAEVRSERLPQSPGRGFSDSESVECRMPHQEVDDEPAAGRDQDRLFNIDLVAVFCMAAAYALQRPDLTYDGDTKNAAAASHKARTLARNILSQENGAARAAGVDCRDRHGYRDAHSSTRLPALITSSSMNAQRASSCSAAASRLRSSSFSAFTAASCCSSCRMRRPFASTCR